MHITELTNSPPSWWVPMTITLPSTVIICGFLFMGKVAWVEYRKSSDARDWNSRYGTV